MNNLPASTLSNLSSADPADRLAAVAALLEPPLTPAALYALSRLAAADPDPEVRAAALAALESESARALYASQASRRDERAALVQQIDRWQIEGLLTPAQAQVLRLRYGFDLSPAPLPEFLRRQFLERVQRWSEQALISPEQAAALAASLDSQPPVAPARPAALPAAPKPAATSRATSPSLSQILFSETSIRIALFLGGFLIVAAALILAALVEVTRLPVLLGLAAASGAGALAARRRMQLPSFVLYIIFASLLPILARVLADLLDLYGPPSHAYWTAAWLLLALALAAGVRLYASRLLSLGALGALVAAAYELAALLPGGFRALGLLLALVAVLGSLGAVLLLRWKSFRFTLPLYLGAHAVALAAALFTAVRTLLDLFVVPSNSPLPEPNRAFWLYFAFAWLVLAGFYLLADRSVRRSAPLPYLAAAALAFFPWTFLQAFPHPSLLAAVVLAAWASLYALGGAALAQRPRTSDFLVRYSRPLMLGSPLLFAWSALLVEPEGALPLLALLLAAALVLASLNILRPRPLAWAGSLLFALAAYFTFFELPVIDRLDLRQSYIVLLAGLLLFAADFFTLSPRNNERWRLPARLYGILLLVVLALYTLFASQPAEQREGALIHVVLALFFLALALRRGLPLVAVAAAISLPAALVLLLRSQGSAHWLPWLAGLAAAFYAAGWLLLRRNHARWSHVFRYAGLALGLLLVARLPLEYDWPAGLALLAAGLLFLVERLRGPRVWFTPWLEIPLDALLVAALFGLLNPITRAHWSLAAALGLLLAALIVLGFELFFSRQSAAPLALRWTVRAVGLLLAALSLAFTVLAQDLSAGWAAAVFAVSTAYALLAARAYPLPRLAYAAVAYLALALFYLLRAFDLDIWLAPEVALAALLYTGSFLLDRRGGASAWVEVLRYGGLGLALLVSLTAPLEEPRLWASLWVACAATLYAVEAFRRRSVWWGFPTDGLYLLAYFLLLIDLRVDQPQFFSLAVAALGMLQHYLLMRTGSRLAAFITGMVSQLVLLGVTYYQMVTTERLGYFVILFFQGLAVLGYGIVLRSRSLVFTPLAFIVVGVTTVVLTILSSVSTAIIIGCTGVTLLVLGILAVALRERWVKVGGKMDGWRA